MSGQTNKQGRKIKHLSNKELEKIQRYMSYLIVEMGLGDNLQIAIRTETAEEWCEKDNAIAGVEVNEQKFHADLFVSADWEGMSDRIKATSLIHECVHILHKRADMAVYDHLDIDWLPIRISQAGKELYMREMEMLVDRVTRILEPRMHSWDRAMDMPLLPSVQPEGDHI